MKVPHACRGGLLIDATTLANDARFMNHSCDPNCQAYSCVVEGQERVAIVTLTHILKGQELTYDYHVKADAEPVLRSADLACLCHLTADLVYLNHPTAAHLSQLTALHLVLWRT